MDRGHAIFALIGFCAPFIVFLPNLKEWKRKQITREKLKIIREALDGAEERATRYEERHDRILSQICSYYFSNTDLKEALAGARTAMNEALEFAGGLRDLQMKVISSYPYES